MAVVFHFVSLVVFAAWVVHRHDESAVKLASNHLVAERLRGVGLWFANAVAILVLESILESFYRFAQCEGKNVVNIAQHFSFACFNGSSWFLVGYHLAKFQAIFAELGRDDRRHARGVFSRITLRHHLHRNQSVLVYKVGNAAKSATIANRTLKEELHHRVVHWLVGVVYNSLEHKVGFLQLVVEAKVNVRKLYAQRIFVLVREV